MAAYVEYLESRAEFETVIEDDRTTGIAVTCRKSQAPGGD